MITFNELMGTMTQLYDTRGDTSCYCVMDADGRIQQMAHLELDDLLRDRILKGENFLERDGDKYFAPYNEIQVLQSVDGRVHIHFMKGGMRVASFSGNASDIITVTGVEAKLTVTVEN